MKVENMTGSHWAINEEIVTTKNNERKTRHCLKTVVLYKREDGTPAESFSRIPIDSSFFSNVGESSAKKFKSFDELAQSKISLKGVLKDGTFDLDVIQRGDNIAMKKHINWKVIPSFINNNEDNRVLLLGGYKGDAIWFDRRGSQSASSGRSVIIAYSQAYDKPDNEQERVVKEVQFAALLDEGETLAYRIRMNGRNFVAIARNVNGRIRFETRTPYAWMSELNERGLLKMPFDKAAPAASKKVAKSEKAEKALQA